MDIANYLNNCLLNKIHEIKLIHKNPGLIKDKTIAIYEFL